MTTIKATLVLVLFYFSLMNLASLSLVTIDRFGDAVFAVFGLANAGPEDAANARGCAAA